MIVVSNLFCTQTRKYSMTFDEKEKRKLNDSLLKKKIVVFLNIESGNIYIGVNVDGRMI